MDFCFKELAPQVYELGNLIGFLDLEYLTDWLLLLHISLWLAVTDKSTPIDLNLT